jgi:hypothetical protein
MNTTKIQISEYTPIRFYNTARISHDNYKPYTLGEFIELNTGAFPHHSVLECRNITDKSQRKAYKEHNVPCVNFQLSPDGEINPFLVIDYENSSVTIPNECTVLRGLSVSGSGEFIVVRLPDEVCESKATYESYAKSVLKYLNIESTKGQHSIDRMRFITHDRNLFINYMAEPFYIPDTAILHAPKVHYNGLTKFLPLDNNSALQCWAYLRNINDKETAAKKIKELPRNSESLKHDADFDKFIEKWEVQYSSDKKGGPDYTPNYYLQYDGYWSNNRLKPTIDLSTGVVRDYMVKNGYCLYDGSIVQIVNGVMSEPHQKQVYDQIISEACKRDVSFEIKKHDGSTYTATFDRGQLKTQAQTKLKGNLSQIALPNFSGEFLRDDAKTCYLHFINLSIKITAGGIEVLERDNTRVIWESQIVQHTLTDNYQEGVIEFRKYIKNISGENENSFLTAIGYAIHSYTGSAGMKAIWLTDEDFAVGKANGRTGKSLFWKAISKLRKHTFISGKDFQPESQFKFQNMTRDTQLFVIDDVKQRFDFKTLYTACTEGLEFQAKHKPLVQLSIHETPKMIICSNTPPRMEEGTSTTGRLHVLPVKPYYMPHADMGGVRHIHKQIFFDDWNEQEWSAFYWSMMLCVQLYFMKGLIPSDLSQIKLNRLKDSLQAKLKSDELAEDFARWVTGKTFPQEFILKDEQIDFEQYAEIPTDSSLNNRVFADALKAYFDIMNIKFIKSRERKATGQVTVWRVFSGSCA